MNDFAVSVPEGRSGNWSVRRFSVSAEESRLDAAMSMFSGGRFVPPGTYTGLYRGEYVIMSDTPDEIRDHRGFVCRSRGRVLIAGLGIGMVLQAVARRPDVSRVTVVENSPDVIALAADHYRAMFAGRVEIVQADILTWKPDRGVAFDCAWFDIWDDLCTDNLDEMATLNRRFARIVPDRGCWGRELLIGRRRQEQSRDRMWRVA